MSSLKPAVTVIIPTLAADDTLTECVDALRKQTCKNFETIIVDNSGQRKVRNQASVTESCRVIENTVNIGFGSAINQGIRASDTPFVVSLNDDALAHADWIAALLRALENRPDVGMCASQVRLFSKNLIDSAGMLISADGSSKQRGHLEPVEKFQNTEEVLLPSGSAALYRRSMLDEIGLFDDDFFLYCEDTDLGLRGRWAGWRCLYVADAIVEHHYSHSAGRASTLKAYLVERNRLFVVAKNFPAMRTALAPFWSWIRYAWHVAAIFQGRGISAEFRADSSGLSLPFLVLRAHVACLLRLPSLWARRRQIQRTACVSVSDFNRLLDTHSITPREVAFL